MPFTHRVFDHPGTSWATCALAAVATWTLVRWEGQPAWCACQTPRAFVGSAWSEHTSQHFLDPYSFTHLQHGLVFWGALTLALPGARSSLRIALAALLEAGWEVAENSAWVIDRYREATAALGYAGDSAVNSVGDLASCMLGFIVASRCGGRWASALFISIEIALVLTIRDSLLLNVLMLLYPVDAVKAWQMGALG